MATLITIACILAALFLLSLLAVIDLKTRLLPNVYVAGFLVTGLVFHGVTQFYFVAPLSMFFGMVAGAGLLLVVRLVANRICGRDTLGLGDVKLIGAAGIWLGLDYIFLAISLGAFAGLLHGFVYGYITQKRTGRPINFSTLSIPAGPGFIAGIVLVGFFAFQRLPKFLLDFF